MSYTHPYLTPNGTIMYHFLSYPCPDSKKWEVLGTALEQNTKKLYKNIVQDGLDDDLKEKALHLYYSSVINNNLMKYRVPYFQEQSGNEAINNNISTNKNIVQKEELNENLKEKNIVGNNTNKNNFNKYRNSKNKNRNGKNKKRNF